jgi:hypothetical protein
MATVAEVINRAGNDLGILRLNQSLQSQDSARITAAYNEVYERLKLKGVAIWASTADVPNVLVPYVVAMICESCLGTYAVSPERFQRIKLEASTAMGNINALAMPDYVSQDEPVDY